MTDKTKSISEALAEVQRKVNEQRMKNAESNWNSVKNEENGDNPFGGLPNRDRVKWSSSTPKMSYSDYSQTGVGTIPPINKSQPTTKIPGTSGATMPGGNAMGAGFGLTGPTSTAGAVKPASSTPVKPTPPPIAKAIPTPPPRPNGAPLPTPAAPAPAPQKSWVAQNADAAINRIGNTSEFEDGGPSKSKGKKSMKEEMSPLVAAFLKLQESKPANMFEAAKKMKAVCPKCGKSPCVCESMEEEKELSPKQKKIAALGGDKKKLDAADFKALRSGKKPMEEADQSDTDTTTGPSGKKYVPDIYKSSKPQKSQSDTDTTTGPDGKRYVPDIYKNMKEETVFVTKRNDISGRKNIMEISKSQYDSRKHVFVSEGNIRLVKTHEKMDSEGQKRTAKVYKDHEWNEYRVKHFTNGKHHHDADYHTDDADDAHNTAKAFLKEEIILEKNWIAGAIKHPGAETRAAEKAGMSVQAYAKKHEHDSGTAGKRARLAITLKKINKEEVEELDDVSEANTPEQLAVKEKLHKSDAFRYKINAYNAKKRGDSDMEKYSSRKAEMHSKAASVAGKMMNKEEVDFSEEELAHFASIIEGDAPSFAPARDDIVNRSDKHDTNSDYGMDEEAKKRGVKAGTKRGPYKQKGLSSGEKDEAQGETKNVPAQVRTARSHFSGGKEVVTLKHPQTDKQYHVPVKHVNDFNKEYAAAEKPHEKNAVERKFMQTHMSN